MAEPALAIRTNTSRREKPVEAVVGHVGKVVCASAIGLCERIVKNGLNFAERAARIVKKTSEGTAICYNLSDFIPG